MVFRRMLLGGAVAITLGTGLACPGLAQAADTPQTPLAPAQVSLAQQDEIKSPSLTIHKAHQDPAHNHPTSVAYTLWVGNDGTGATHGTYTVVDNLPDGLIETSAEGRHWDCDANTTRTVVTCKSDAELAPGTSGDPIIVHTDITDKNSCLLVNIAAVSGGDRDRPDGNGVVGDRGDDRGGREVHFTKDVLQLPCHRHEADKDGVNVTVNVTGNNNGGHGGDSSGATADDNGHVHGVTGGGAKADADADAKAKAEAKAKSQAKGEAKVHRGHATAENHNRDHDCHREHHMHCDKE